MTITATNRLFLRAKPTRDPDGNLLYVFTEAYPASLERQRSLSYIPVPRKGTISNRWEILVTQSGVRHGMLKARDRYGNQHNRALRRIEEDHLMKFAIPA